MVTPRPIKCGDVTFEFHHSHKGWTGPGCFFATLVETGSAILFQGPEKELTSARWMWAVVLEGRTFEARIPAFTPQDAARDMQRFLGKLERFSSLFNERRRKLLIRICRERQTNFRKASILASREQRADYAARFRRQANIFMSIEIDLRDGRPINYFNELGREPLKIKTEQEQMTEFLLSRTQDTKAEVHYMPNGRIVVMCSDADDYPVETVKRRIPAGLLLMVADRRKDEC